MVLETSALIAILREEPEASAFVRIIQQATICRMSAVSLLEASIIAQADSKNGKATDLDNFLQRAAITIEPFDEEQALLAREAYTAYGKGNHPARLNFGDCASYALAKLYGEPLLFKGRDFVQTDVIVATSAFYPRS